MHCPTCGRTLEEGKAFCKYCGTRLPADAAPTLVLPPVEPTAVAPPPPAWGPVPPPPRFAAPPPRSGSKTGLIVLIAIAALLLVGGGVVAAAFFLFASTESEGERTQTSGVVVVTTLSPGTNPTTDATTQTSSTGTTGYVQALDGLDQVLADCDERMPVLADQINNTAPRVPGSVSKELENLFTDVEEARSALGELEPPPAYQEADHLVFEAADAMQNRIDQTSKGIDAMWNEGTVAAGTPYFDEGRRARDQFRTFFDEYRAAKP